MQPAKYESKARCISSYNKILSSQIILELVKSTMNVYE